MKQEHRLTAVVTNLYNLFLYLYPAPFRREFGREMVLVFRDESNYERSRGGMVAMFSLWMEFFIDLATTAFAEHIWEVFHMPKEKMTRWSGPAAAIAGLLWVSLFLIEVEGNLGFLLYVPVFPLMVVGLAGLYQRLPASLRLGSRLAFGVALMGLLIMLVVALGIILIPGTTDFVFGTLWGALALFLPVIVGIAGMGLIAIYTRAFGRLSFVPLAQAAFFLGIFLTADIDPDPVQTTFLLLFGISWVLLGFALWSTGEDVTGPALPA